MNLVVKISDFIEVLGTDIKNILSRLVTLENSASINHSANAMHQAARLIQTQNIYAKQYKESNNE